MAGFWHLKSLETGRRTSTFWAFSAKLATAQCLATIEDKSTVGDKAGGKTQTLALSRRRPFFIFPAEIDSYPYVGAYNISLRDAPGTHVMVEGTAFYDFADFDGLTIESTDSEKSRRSGGCQRELGDPSELDRRRRRQLLGAGRPWREQSRVLPHGELPHRTGTRDYASHDRRDLSQHKFLSKFV